MKMYENIHLNFCESLYCKIPSIYVHYDVLDFVDDNFYLQTLNVTTNIKEGVSNANDG